MCGGCSTTGSGPHPSLCMAPFPASTTWTWVTTQGKLKRRRFGWMERFKERACIDRNWMKRGGYSVGVKRVRLEGECGLVASAGPILLLAQRMRINAEQRKSFIISLHQWDDQGAFIDRSGSKIVTPHRSRISDLLSNGDIAITSSSDGTALAWNIETSQMLCTVAKHEAEIMHSRLASTHTLVTAATDLTIALWDVRTGKRTCRTEQQQLVRCLGVSGDESTLVSGSWDGIVRVWDRRKLDVPAAMLQTGGMPTALHLHEQGLLVAGNYSFPEEEGAAGFLQRWEGDQLSSSDLLGESVWHLASSEEHRVLFSQGSTVVAYNIVSPGALATHAHGCSLVESLLFDPTRLVMVGAGEMEIHDFSGRFLDVLGYRPLHGIRII